MPAGKLVKFVQSPKAGEIAPSIIVSNKKKVFSKKSRSKVDQALSLSKHVFKQMKENVEYKVHDINFTLTPLLNVFQQQVLNKIIQLYTSTTRIGFTVSPKGLSIKFKITSGTEPAIVRIIILQKIADITVDSPLTLTDVLSHKNLDITTTARTLFDRLYSVNEFDDKKILVTHFIKNISETQYDINDDQGVDFKRGEITLWAISDQETEGPTLQASCRLRYTDK